MNPSRILQHKYIYPYTPIDKNTSICIYTKNVFIHVFTYLYRYIHTYTRIYTPAYNNPFINTLIPLHIHMHVRVHTFIQASPYPLMPPVNNFVTIVIFSFCLSLMFSQFFIRFEICSSLPLRLFITYLPFFPKLLSRLVSCRHKCTVFKATKCIKDTAPG